jgi:hypothetical protein
MEMIRITGKGSETLIRDAGRIERFLVGPEPETYFPSDYESTSPRKTDGIEAFARTVMTGVMNGPEVDA